MIAEVVDEAREHVRQGETLAEPLSKHPIFPPMVTKMIGIGEKSGALEVLLEKISIFYDDQVNAEVKGLTSLIEPILIGVIGFLVAGIVLAVFLPIFKLQQSLVPPEWSRIEAEVPVRPPRTKVTIDLDEDVAKWFRRMGHGYQRRVNAVLRTYMLALISKEILSEGDRTRDGREIWGLPAKKEKKPRA